MRYAYKVETMGAEDIPIHTLVKLPRRIPRVPASRPQAPTLPATVRPPARSRAQPPALPRAALAVKSVPRAGAAPVEASPPSHRRQSPRRSLSARVSLWTPRESHGGWTLNVSDGGLRVLVEDAVVASGAEVTVEVREDACAWQRKAKVVWVKQEPGGCVAGLQFLKATSILGLAPANDASGEDILSDKSPIYSSKFSVG